MSKKKELGKGLRALLSNIENNQNVEEKREVVRDLTSQYALIKTDAIEVNPFQPRTEFDQEELLELAKSIKVHGIIQPLTVRSLGGKSFQIISGERRWRASKMAGLTEVPAYIRIADDQEMLEMALIENIQRSDLNALEIAISYQRLMDECALTHEALSDRVGKNRSTVTNYVRLLKLPPDIQSAIKNNTISMGHARALAGIENVVRQLDAFKQTVKSEWSVRALENYLKDEKAGKKARKGQEFQLEETELKKIVREISTVFGTPVKVKRDAAGKGQIVISFNNDREFNSIFDIIKEMQ